MMDHELAIRIFIAVADEQSFSAGARKIGIPQSTASRQISRLEERLGAKLFHRTTRTFSVTEVGQRFYKRSKQIVYEIDDAISVASQSNSLASGLLRITMPSAFGRKCIIPLLPEFRKSHPNVQFGLSLTDNVQDVIGLGFDISFRLGSLPDSGLVAQKLVATESLLCASPGYLRKHGAPKSVDDLEHHNCLQFRDTPGHNLWDLLEKGKLRRVKVSGDFYANDGGGIMIAALNDLGISFLPDWIVADEIENGNLVRLLPNVKDARPNAVYAVYASRQHLPEKVTSFVEYIKSNLL